MKLLKSILGLFFFTAILLSNRTDISAAPAPVSINQEKITDFATEIRIKQDATIDVREMISYDFGIGQKHGIFRDIPLEYTRYGGKYRINISNIAVTNTALQEQMTQLSIVNRNYQRLKIGNPNKTITGLQTYVISYKIENAINFLDGYDELLWNSTGNEWTVPIEKSHVKIWLATSTAEADLKIACYRGSFGSANNCAKAEKIAALNGQVREINFSESFLAPGSGLTVSVAWPTGQISKPDQLRIFLRTVKDNWLMGLPFLAFILMFSLWRRYGRDPLGRGTIVAQFDVPDGLMPAETGVMIDESSDNRDLTAEIVYLATRGYLKITHLSEKILLFDVNDFLFEKLKDDTTGLNHYQENLLESLFRGGRIIKLSELKKHFADNALEIKNQIYASMSQKKLFKNKRPDIIRFLYLILSMAIFFAGIATALEAQSYFSIDAISLTITGIIVIIFGWNMPAKTEKGTLIKEHIEGLKLYLDVAEKDRLDFHNAPEKNAAQFEKLLPYAIALGVENAWSTQFDNIYDTNPSWYHGSNRIFSPSILTDELKGFSTAINASARPKGSGSSHSSGGGFGGGGGGSW